MPAMRCKSRELAPPSTSFTRPRPTSTVRGSTWSSASMFSLAGFSALSVEVLTAASFFRRMRQPMAPSPPPKARKGMVGKPGNNESATSTPLASSSGSDLPNTWVWNCAPSLESELARVTIKPPEIEIISAGITVTRPSPMVSTV